MKFKPSSAVTGLEQSRAVPPGLQTEPQVLSPYELQRGYGCCLLKLLSEALHLFVTGTLSPGESNSDSPGKAGCLILADIISHSQVSQSP